MHIRLIGFPLLLGVAACATANTSSTRAALAPRNGPHARVYANYTGGLTGRTVRTRFEVSETANVLVGRLGGDGSIEILFPETPRASSLVSGNKTYTARTFEAEYDGVPQLYSYASHVQRSYGAYLDSYDGRGNGFVFIIASEHPLATEKLDDHGEWSDSLEVENYFNDF